MTPHCFTSGKEEFGNKRAGHFPLAHLGIELISLWLCGREGFFGMSVFKLALSLHKTKALFLPGEADKRIVFSEGV